MTGGFITIWHGQGRHSACPQPEAKGRGLHPGPDTEPGLPAVVRGRFSGENGPEHLRFCAGAARSGSDRLGRGRWVKSADVWDPWAQGFLMEEVHSQLE